jgi:hypothetical protein
LILARQFAALAAGVALRLPRTFRPARVRFIAIVSRILTAWTAVAARIAGTVTPNVAISIAISTIAVSISVAAAAIAIVPDVAMLRPVALRLRRCSGRLGRGARSRIAKQPAP